MSVDGALGPVVLTAFGLPHVIGSLKTRDGEAYSNPLTPTGLMDTAVEWGLGGLELVVPTVEADAVARLRDELQQRSLTLVSAFGVVADTELERLRAQVQASAAAGARVMRVILSGILCGERWKLEEGWESRLQRTTVKLRELLPFAHDHGVAIAVENHQDAATEDLLLLAEMVDWHPAFGVTLDAGNPLAVGQDPVEAARELAPLIRHIHLKDYTIHFAPEGYRLVRCPAGSGVVDFRGILEAVRGNGHTITPGCEVAAQATRTIPLLTEQWWTSFPERKASTLVGPLKLLWQQGRPAAEPYSSAWERGECSAVVAAEEWDVARKSAVYLRDLVRGMG